MIKKIHAPQLQMVGEDKYACVICVYWLKNFYLYGRIVCHGSGPNPVVRTLIRFDFYNRY